MALFIFSTPAWADQIMNVTTGYGFITETSTGHIVAKYDLPMGEHPLKDGYSFVELTNRGDFNAVNIFMAPVTEKASIEIKIQKEIRNTALDDLVTKGEITKAQADGVKTNILKISN